MAYICYTATQMQNLGVSMRREVLLANSVGAYCSTTLINCNTRKYHGLLVVPQPRLDGNLFVLLSCLDETIFRNSKKTDLSTHHYPHTVHPKGYKNIIEFSYERTPQWMIRAGDILLKKELILLQNEARILIRYTVVECEDPFTMQFRPLLAFRNIHTIAKSNLLANPKHEIISSGLTLNMYSGLDAITLQFSKKCSYVNAPDWYYNNEYPLEEARGYEYKEDLYSPGRFNKLLKKGDELVFSAGLSELSIGKLKTIFKIEHLKQKQLKNFDDCLKHAARQFIITDKKSTGINAGYHWFGRWGRDTFIALPGLTLATGQPKLFKSIIDSMLGELNNGIFPNIGFGVNATYNTTDASLWFFRALQHYALYTGSLHKIWAQYGEAMKAILTNYMKGVVTPGARFIKVARMLPDGLLYNGEKGAALTWMDALINGKPVTPRTGLAVELNGLWYNAIRFALETAAYSHDSKFIGEWEHLPLMIEASFKKTFWNGQKGYLADCVDGTHTDWSLRPNQIIAVSLPYSPVSDDIKKSVVNVVENKLLTPRGLRTLSPDAKQYIGVYEGDQQQRDRAYHNGTVWPWLLGPFFEAYLSVHGEKGTSFVENYLHNFESAIMEYGIGTIPELYDGNSPHRAGGAISQAWSVGEILRIRQMIGNGQFQKRMDLRSELEK